MVDFLCEPKFNKANSLRTNLFISATIFPFLLLPLQAQAQTYPSGGAPIPPVATAMDPNGVDMASGAFVTSTPEISIGNGSGTLKFRFSFDGTSWRHNLYMAILSSSSSATVITGNSSETFSLSGTTYTSASGSGSTLTASGSNFIYTTRDGAVINFSATGFAATPATANWGNEYGSAQQGGGGISAIATSMNLPTGEIINFTYATRDYVHKDKDYGNIRWRYYRLQSANSNAGYQAKFAHGNNNSGSTEDLDDLDVWSRVAQVMLINNAVDYCAPGVDSCSGLTGAWPSLGITYALGSGSSVLLNITDPLGGVTQFGLDGSPTYRPLSVKPPASNTATTTVSYGSNSRVGSVTRGGTTYTYTGYTVGGGVGTSVSTPSGLVGNYAANPSTGHLLGFTDPNGYITIYVEDASGRITSVISPEGNKETYTYDSRGNVTSKVVTPKSGSGLSAITITSGYDSNCTSPAKCNKPNWVMDGMGNQTDYTYDSTTGVLTSATMPADSSGLRPQTRYTYSPLQAYTKNSSGSIVATGQNVVKLTGVSFCRTNTSCTGTSDELKTSISYGPQTPGTGNNLLPVSQTVAAGDYSVTATSAVGYDAMGNVVSSVGQLGSSQTLVAYYDASRRLLGAVSPDPDGAGPRTPSAVKYSYNADGILTLTQIGTVADQSTTAWSNFSEVYRKADILDAYDRVTRSTLRSAGADYAVIDQLYDSLGRKSCSIQYMNLSAVPGSVASNCAPYQTSGPYGPDRVESIAYDPVGRQQSVSDGIGMLITKTYTPNGQLATVKDGNNNLTSYNYDGFDRPLQTIFPSTTTGAGSSNGNDYQQVLAYDSNSHPTQVRLRDGNTIGLSYDNLGRLTSRTPQTNLSYPYDYQVNYSYNLIGQLTQIARPGDGMTLSYGYDAFGRQTQEVQPFGTMAYQYDVAGRRTRVTWPDGFYVTYDYDTLGLATAIREAGSTTLASYGYDSLGRRTSVSFGNGTGRNYAYDAVNRLAGLQLTFPNSGNNQLIGAVGGSGTALGYTPSSQLASVTRSNDAYAWAGAYNVNRSYTVNGLNQYTQSGGVGLGYDARGNLISSGSSGFGYSKQNELISAPGATIYYDPLSRVSEFDTTSSTRFVYDGGSISTEIAGGTITRRYVMGPGTDEPIVWYEGSGTSDRRFLQADERGSILAVSDGSGAMLGINKYDEFGIPASGNIGRFQYTGQAWFPETGLYNYKARFYSPTLGRFMQTDPVGYGDGLNWYNYAHGDPINRTDPLGLATDCKTTEDGILHCDMSLEPPSSTGIRNLYWGGSINPSGGSITFSSFKTPEIKQKSVNSCDTPYFRNLLGRKDVQDAMKQSATLGQNDKVPGIPGITGENRPGGGCCQSEYGFNFGYKFRGGTGPGVPFSDHAPRTIDPGLPGSALSDGIYWRTDFFHYHPNGTGLDEDDIQQAAYRGVNAIVFGPNGQVSCHAN